MSAGPPSAASTGRPLTPGEQSIARAVFGDAIDYAAVRVHHRDFVFWQGANYIITPNGHIYLGRRLRGLTDFSAAGLAMQGLFIHEMAHVWQHQRGVNVLVRGALEQVRHFCGFNQYRYRLESGKALGQYKLEQQGEILRHFFLARQGQPTPYTPAQYLAALGSAGPTIV
ncbi:hypothetical protein SAMN04488595_109122 [Ralstonia sp. 25mfcol4.1]|uniref:hypothetical protein n=1 Tax=Burkholderiaceae TaxID=119060 RepID=UPI000880E872|nr:hypothetical protein [Ralstonia sp. 25mfcol4.1]SDP44896.1 hypothetical protein SAMN04488595_109122 [Ralstonia sp. 25mfcol4.1]